MLSAELIVEFDALRTLEQEWSALADACGLPLMTPVWALAWWEHIAPRDAEPRVIAVREGSLLTALAPFYIVRSAPHRIDYRLPGIEIAARLSPLALPGCEWDAARLIAETLQRARPRPDLIALEGHPLASPWAAALRERWPSRKRPLTHRYLIHGAPTISLSHPSFEEWLASKSANFRGQMRKARRDFLAAGGTTRISTPERLEADFDAFLRLHAARWQMRANSSIVAFAAELQAMLLQIASGDPQAQRMRLWMLEIDGEPISAQLFLAAGGEVAYVNGGWDERFARLHPAMLGILCGVEDAFARGERRVDLGAGDQHYKRRLADGNDPVAWTILIPPGRRRALTCARVAPMLAQHLLRDAAKRRLAPEQLNRLRGLRSRLRARAAGR